MLEGTWKHPTFLDELILLSLLVLRFNWCITWISSGSLSSLNIKLQDWVDCFTMERVVHLRSQNDWPKGILKICSLKRSAVTQTGTSKDWKRMMVSRSSAQFPIPDLLKPTKGLQHEGQEIVLLHKLPTCGSILDTWYLATGPVVHRVWQIGFSWQPSPFQKKTKKQLQETTTLNYRFIW